MKADPVNQADTERKHATYFFDQLDERKEDWFSSKQEKVVTEKKSEFDKILAAGRWAYRHRRRTLLSQALQILGNYWRREGRLKAGREAFALAREAFTPCIAIARCDCPHHPGTNSHLAG